MKPESTPRPWKLEGNHIMAGQNTIAVCAQGWSDDQANAELIINAVNIYDSLVTPSSRSVTVLRALQSQMEPEERKQLWATITEGYCEHCGRDTSDGPCHCWNDE